jgi:hypothetical protein
MLTIKWQESGAEDSDWYLTCGFCEGPPYRLQLADRPATRDDAKAAIVAHYGTMAGSTGDDDPFAVTECPARESWTATEWELIGQKPERGTLRIENTLVVE